MKQFATENVGPLVFLLRHHERVQARVVTDAGVQVIDVMAPLAVAVVVVVVDAEMAETIDVAEMAVAVVDVATVAAEEGVTVIVPAMVVAVVDPEQHALAVAHLSAGEAVGELPPVQP